MSEDDDMKAYGYEGEIIAVLIPKEKQELKKPRRFKVVILNGVDYNSIKLLNLRLINIIVCKKNKYIANYKKYYNTNDQKLL